MILSALPSYSIPLFIVGIAEIIIGLAVFLSRKEFLQGLFLLFSLFVGLWCVFLGVISLGISPDIMDISFRIVALSGAFIPISILLFTEYFPDNKPSLNTLFAFRFLLPLLFVIAALSPTNLLLLISEITETKLGVELGPLALPYVLSFILPFSWVYFKLFFSFVHSKGMRKTQIAYFLLGLILTSAIGIFCNVLLVYFGTTNYIYVGGLGTIFLIGFAAFSITKYDFLDIRVLITRTAAYGFVGALIIASFVGLNALTMPMAAAMATNAALAIAWAWAAHRLRAFIQTPLEEKWITGWYNSDKLINSIARKLVPVFESGEAFKMIAEEIKNTIKIKSYEIITDKRNIEAGDIKQTKAGLVVPLVSSEGIEGAIVLGQKVSEDPYSEQDIMIFKTITVQALAILDRIRPYEKVKREFEASQQKLFEAEKQLERAQRLSSLGRIISEVAHEIRNPLAVIYSKADRLKANAGNPGYLAEAADLIVDRCEQIEKVVGTMSALDRPPKHEPQALHIPDPIESALRFMPHQSNVSIVRLFAPTPPIAGDRHELERVFINLFTNAFDAMAEKGGELRLKSRMEGTYVRIEVEDTGPGISKEDLPKIFEPFFAPKFGKVDDRMGFGLSIVHDIIVEKHKGTISAQSEPGKGAKFIITLPAKIS